VETSVPTVFFYLASIVSAILAMKTKENAFTLPLSIALYEFTFFEGKVGRRLSYLVPFFLTLLIIPLGMIDIGRPVGELIGDVSLATKSQTEMSRWDYLLTQFRVIVTYIRLIFLPMGQNLDYDYPIYHSLLNAEVFMSFLFLLSLIGFGIIMLYRSKDKGELRLAAFGALWFFITLMVESSLIPIVDVIFEQRVYLPSVGAFSAITVSAFFLIKRQRRQQKLATVLVAFILIVLSCATYARNIVWQSEISLWEDNALKSPSKFRVIVNLADAYVKNSRLTESIDALDKALMMPEGMKPESAEAYNILGVAFLKLQEYGKANRAFLKAITLNPGHPNTYSSLAALYGELGDFVSAAKASKKAIELNPYDKTAYNNLGLAYASTGQHLKAIAMYKKSIGINPYYAEARYNLALSYLAIGKKGGAIGEYNLLKDLNQALTDKLLMEIKEAHLE
jgi:tetratricopeptide (TPR) repeat protein